MPDITGTTRLYAVLGDPVDQVRAPGLVNRLFDRLGSDAVLVPMRVRPGDLAAVLAALHAIGNVDGLLVTVPHKVAAARLAGSASAAVRLSGAANALRRDPAGGWHADNFDGAGFLAGLVAAGVDPAGRRVALVGAGGAAASIGPALLGAGVARLSVSDVDTGRAVRLARRLAQAWPGRVVAADRPELGTADLAVNATPLGLRPDDPLPFDPAGVPPGAVVADIVMQPPETALLRAAAALGRRAHPGAAMLVCQLDLYQVFFGLTQRPPGSADPRSQPGDPGQPRERQR